MHSDHNNPSFSAERVACPLLLNSELISTMRLQYSSTEVVRSSSVGLNNLTSNGRRRRDHTDSKMACLQLFYAQRGLGELLEVLTL